jgi:hypothetical protein
MHLLPVSAVFIWGRVFPRQLEITVTYTESYIDSETASLHLSFKIHKFSYYSYKEIILKIHSRGIALPSLSN